MLPIADANIILRYLLQDVEEQFEYARSAIEEGCEITVEILAEVVYVLEGVYHVPRKLISATLIDLMDIVHIERYDEAVDALKLFSIKKLDFVDCLLVAMNQIHGRAIITFDKKLKRLVS